MHNPHKQVGVLVDRQLNPCLKLNGNNLTSIDKYKRDDEEEVE